MTNFYEELSLERNLSLEKINTELTRLESIWKHREITNPEQATCKLALIIQARKVFETEESRRKFDSSLNVDEESKSIGDKDDIRQADAKKWYLEANNYLHTGQCVKATKAITQALSLIHEEDAMYDEIFGCSVKIYEEDYKRQLEVKKWYNEANKYFNTKQFDLAKEALERALPYVQEDDTLCSYGEIMRIAAYIYSENLDSEKAIACANKAIISDPDNIAFLYAKSDSYLIKYAHLMEAKERGIIIAQNEFDTTIIKYREALQVLLNKAIQAQNKDVVEEIYEDLAESFYDDYPQDKTKAIEYANSAVAVMKERLGDAWMNAYQESRAKSLLDEAQKENNSYYSGYSNYSGYPSASSKQGGCYIATAVYGSYNCPQVWVLRRFRDFSLSRNWFGRAFIKCYYAISPTLVKWFGEAKWFRSLWKKPLDKLVDKLCKEGYSDESYKDCEENILS